MPQHLRPFPVAAPPTPAQLATLAAVLDAPSDVPGGAPSDAPSDVLLPVEDNADGERVAAAARPAEPLRPTGSGEPLVLGVATTGSTGTPKIVLHTARSLRASIDATAEVCGGHGQWLLCLGINHIAGIQVVLRAAVAGTELVVAPAGGPTFPADFARAAARLDGTRRYVSMVPTQLRRLLTEQPVPAERPALEALRSFDAILLGGAAADAALLQQAEAAGVHIVTTYGMSETAGGCVYDGSPLPGVEVGLRDGIVTLTGDVVAAGYRDRPAPDPFAGRTFTTSDLGEIHQGRLRILGRADDLINTGGKKVSPLRVEQALRTLADVEDAIVVGVPDPEWGARTVALVLRRDRSGGATAVREALRDRLAPYELPTQVLDVPALPHKGIGKPDREAALRLALQLLSG